MQLVGLRQVAKQKQIEEIHQLQAQAPNVQKQPALETIRLIDDHQTQTVSSA